MVYCLHLLYATQEQYSGILEGFTQEHVIYGTSKVNIRHCRESFIQCGGEGDGRYLPPLLKPWQRICVPSHKPSWAVSLSVAYQLAPA